MSFMGEDVLKLEMIQGNENLANIFIKTVTIGKLKLCLAIDGLWT